MNPLRIPRPLPILLALVVATFSLRAEWNPTPVPTVQPLTESGPLWFRCFVRVPDNMTIPAEKDLWRDSITL
ncbi:MAG TPA: hypothetical protein VGO90_04835, partial [Chthoniobacteraceae bacterium]|nr:hypothetical protein [Chthoniobacteraceae bacterium]